MEHCDKEPELTVPENGDLDQQDVFGVTGLTESVDSANGNVTLALNDKEIFHAYNTSCARADGSFEEFRAEVQREANLGASQVYTEARQINDNWNQLSTGVRMVWIRICIKLRWIKIYVNWHI